MAGGRLCSPVRARIYVDGGSARPRLVFRREGDEVCAAGDRPSGLAVQR